MQSALPPLHFRGVVLGPSGFAAQGREWLRLLEERGFCPSLEGALLGHLEGGESEADRLLITRCAERAFRSGSVTLHHMLAPHFQPDLRARADVLLTLFETLGLPDGWAEVLAPADAVVVPTTFNRESFARGGVDLRRLHVVPPPVDTRPFQPGTEPLAGLPHRGAPFRWLSVFDWSQRKGVDLLVAAFGRAFREGEAELMIKITPHRQVPTPRLRDACERVLRRSAGGTPPGLILVDDVLPPHALPGLYAAADAFALPSRGEGWGRPVQEAMLMELPVVATGAGSLSTLLPNDDVGYPVRGHRVPVSPAAIEETPAFAGQEWIEADMDHLAARLREVVDDPEGARQRGRRARAHALSLCDPDRISDALVSCIRSALPVSA